MKVRAAFAVGLALALGGAQAAEACSRLPDPNYNRFTDWGRAPGAEITERVVAIDWVVVEKPGHRSCAPSRRIGRFERWFWTEIAASSAIISTGWDLSDLFTSLPVAKVQTGTCDGKPVRGLIAPMRARVIERIAGSGPRVFPLFERVGPASADWRAFGNDRESYPDGWGNTWRGGYSGYADIRHRSLAFLDNGRLATPRESTMCGGGDPHAQAGLRYLVLRDAASAVVGMTEVRHADDDLLVRLRRHRGDWHAFIHPRLPARDFISASDGWATVRVTRCYTDTIGKRADAVFLTGDRDALWLMSRPSRYRQDLDWLGMHLERTGQACRAGDTVMILKSPFAHETPRIPYSRAVVVRDGKIRPRDFLTGFTLTGPAEVGVNQVKAWIAEGRASRAASR